MAELAPSLAPAWHQRLSNAKVFATAEPAQHHMMTTIEAAQLPLDQIAARLPSVPRQYHAMDDFAGLATRLQEELAASAHASDPHSPSRIALDTFLLAAGMHQVLEDYLWRDVGSLRTIARHLTGVRFQALRPAAGAATGLAALLQEMRALGDRNLHDQARRLSSLVERLAEQVAGTPRDTGEDTLRSLTEWLRDTQAFPAALRGSVGRLPICFSKVGQEPLDCRELVRAFARRWPQRSRPLAVVGIRTSGSYLAPLIGAYLRSEGYLHVAVLSWRSGQNWSRPVTRQLAAWGRAGGLTLLTDDPPISGGSLAELARRLERLGLSPPSIVVMFQALESPGWWPFEDRLKRYERVTLPRERWALQTRMEPAAVQQTLTHLLRGKVIRLSPSADARTHLTVARVSSAERLPIPAPAPQDELSIAVRARPQTRFKLQLIEADTGQRFEHHVLATSTGLGYFGDPARVVAARLADFLPEVYGVEEGVLYREWMPEAQRAQVGIPVDPDVLARETAAYLATRERALPLSEDLGERAAGRTAMWERCAHLLSPAFGRWDALARVLLRATFKRLVRPSRPSLIDGHVTPRHWFVARPRDPFARPMPGKLLKVDFERGAVHSGMIYCYDAVYDLAGAAVAYRREGHPAGDADAFGRRLRERFAELAAPVTAERWLLYQLLQLADWRGLRLYEQRLSERGERADARHPAAPRLEGVLEALGPRTTQMSTVHQSYFGDLFLADVSPGNPGPVAAVDVDGVLESSWLSFAAITPAGATALRALLRHGYGVILTTGRSLPQVRERCGAYRLTGGVAEYGAAIYNHLRGEERVLLDPSQQAELAAVRTAVNRSQDIHVDAGYRYAVRAYRLHGGRRTGLLPEDIQAALTAAAPGRVVAIHGQAQTDFTHAGVDKGTGLKVLLADLGIGSTEGLRNRPLRFAMGDTAADLPVLRLAEHAYAPSNAEASLRRAAGVRLTSRPFQAGLLQAVGHLLGHRPGRCPLCRPAVPSPEAQLLLRLLSAQDTGRWGKLALALRLAQRRAA